MNKAKVFYALGTLLFAAFTVLQFNDAGQYGNYDAWIWIVIYGAMAALNAWTFFKSLAKHWLYAWCGFCWGSLLFRIQDSQGNLHLGWLHPQNIWDQSGNMIQNTNESGGLLILAVWATLMIILRR